MKIGILTLHDATNYGANLQAYALYKVLLEMGHEVVLVDRRRSAQGLAIGYPFSSESRSMHIRRTLGLTGVFQERIHAWNTYLFQRLNMKFTPYHFHDWKDAPRDMGVDLLVVGSDQIWNKRINDPFDYMPARFPENLPAITYAASMGMPEIPSELIDEFKREIPQFKQISVRELDLQAALARLGIHAQHVADPVVLFGANKWQEFVGNVREQKGRVFIYAFLGDVLGLKKHVAQWTKGRVDLFPCRHFTSIPSFRHPRSVLRNVKYWVRLLFGRGARVRLLTGPKGFLKSLAQSEVVITNSFHGFIFGVMLCKNVRYVVPNAANKGHADMLGRITGYADKFIQGPLLQPSWEAAFQSIADGETIQVDFDGIEMFRQKSCEWLRDAIASSTETKA